MAVRFLFGRAGTGKTHACLQAIREHLRADPIDGPAVVLFLPEQAAVQAERNLLAVEDLAGASRYHTLSFRRLQQLVLQETGLADREVVGQIGRQMIVQYLLSRSRRQLRMLEKVAERPGTAAKVAAGLVEFMQQGILPDQLRRTAEQVEGARRDGVAGGTGRQGSAGVDGGTARTMPAVAGGSARKVPAALLAGKLHDLALLYELYLGWLSEHQQADPEALLVQTADQVDRLEWLRGALVWVDGFAGLSVQQRYTLVRLAQVASQVQVCLLMDPRLLETGQPPEPHDLFYRTWQTAEQLRQAFGQAGVTVEEPVVLRPTTPPRFGKTPLLCHVERQVFETDMRAVRALADKTASGTRSGVGGGGCAGSAGGGGGGCAEDRRSDEGGCGRQGDKETRRQGATTGFRVRGSGNNRRHGDTGTRRHGATAER